MMEKRETYMFKAALEIEYELPIKGMTRSSQASRG